MPSFCTTTEFRKPIANEDGSYTVQIAGDSQLHEFNGMPLKELSTEEYMRRGAPPVLLEHGRTYTLPVAMTKQICYDEQEDVWSATFVFVQNDEMAEKCRNIFEQGLLYPSISWYVDELSLDWRTSEKKLLEWSLTANPRDTTVFESFNKQKMKIQNDTTDCQPCEDEKTFSKAQLDEAIEKIKQEYSALLDDSASEIDAVKKELDEVKQSFSEAQKINDDLQEKLNAASIDLESSHQEFQTLKNQQKAKELIERYSTLLPNGSSSETPDAVLREACGKMIIADQEYSLDQLVMIADNLLLERAEAGKCQQSINFGHLPRDPYDVDPYSQLFINKSN